MRWLMDPVFQPVLNQMLEAGLQVYTPQSLATRRTGTVQQEVQRDPILHWGHLHQSKLNTLKGNFVLFSWP